ncbi:MAG: hypothetical protein QXR45_09220 [Candidatus Bathyarchaeia archaeon]
MSNKINIAILGKTLGQELGYINYLQSMSNISLKYISTISEARSYPALILLEKTSSDQLIKLLEERDIKMLIAVPFADSFEEEVELLSEIRRLNAKVFIPLMSRHHPALVRFRSLLQRKLLGDVFSIFMKFNFNYNYLREEPPLVSSSITFSGKLLHQLVNIIDYLLWLQLGNISQIDVWAIDKTRGREILIVDAKLDNTLLTFLSYTHKGLSSSCKSFIRIEAAGLERMLVWSGYEQSLIVEDNSTSHYEYWGIDPGEIIARHFFEIIKGKSQFELKEIFKSYEETLKYLKSGRLKHE